MLIELYRHRRPCGLFVAVDAELHELVLGFGPWGLGSDRIPSKVLFFQDPESGQEWRYCLRLNRLVMALGLLETSERQAFCADKARVYRETCIDGPLAAVRNGDGDPLNCQFGNLSVAKSKRTLERRRLIYRSEDKHREPEQVHHLEMDKDYSPDRVEEPRKAEPKKPIWDLIKEVYGTPEMVALRKRKEAEALAQEAAEAAARSASQPAQPDPDHELPFPVEGESETWESEQVEDSVDEEGGQSEISH